MIKEILLSLDLLTANKIADAIFRAEGGDKTKHPYGILIKTSNPRHICLNTINHAWCNFEQENMRNGKLATSLPFINFLGNRYCPPSVDSKGFRNWTNNVWRILNK